MARSTHVEALLNHLDDVRVRVEHATSTVDWDQIVRRLTMAIATAERLGDAATPAPRPYDGTITTAESRKLAESSE
jgi:hypothetical protein